MCVERRGGGGGGKKRKEKVNFRAGSDGTIAMLETAEGNSSASLNAIVSPLHTYRYTSTCT